MNGTVMLRCLERGFLFVGLVLVGLWIENYGETYAFQSVESQRLDRLVDGSDTTREELASGVTLGRIVIPRLGISAMIAEGVSPSVLQHAVGHVRATPRPGDPGNVALAGHRDTFFRGLGGVHTGDAIRVVTPLGTYGYRVEWGGVVRPGRVDVLDSTATPSLTLVTCYPFDVIGHAPERFIVRARQTSFTESDGAKAMRLSEPRVPSAHAASSHGVRVHGRAHRIEGSAASRLSRGRASPLPVHGHVRRGGIRTENTMQASIMRRSPT